MFPKSFPQLSTLLRWSLFGTGISLISVSIFQSWFDIPLAMACDVHDSSETMQVTPTSPGCQSAFQIAMGFCLAVWLVVWWRISSRPFACFAASNLVLLCFMFPYFVLQKNPVIVADATWLQMQHDNLTWLGGDINTSAEFGNTAWKSNVYLVDPPRKMAVAPIPGWSVWDIGLDKLEDILIWLGYSNTFCQFVRSGWSNALLGSILLSLFSVLKHERVDILRLGQCVAYVSVLASIFIGLALYSPFCVKELMNQAATSISNGDYELAVRKLDEIESRFPILSQDTNFIRQRGLCEYKMKARTPYARLWSASKDEAAGFNTRAFENWKRLNESNNPAIRREALRAVLRYAINDYNSGRVELAEQRMDFLLKQQPANLKVVYYLQILGLRTGDTEAVYRMCDWMYEVTHHFNFQTVKTLRASSQRHAMLAANLSGDPHETWIRIIRAKNP